MSKIRSIRNIGFGLACVACGSFAGLATMGGTSVAAQNAAEVRVFVARVKSARSWKEKLRLYDGAVRRGETKELGLAADETLKVGHDPLDAAVLTCCWVRWQYLIHAGLERSTATGSMQSDILQFMKTSAASKSPQCLYAQYLLLGLPQPPMSGDHYKMITVGVTHPDGTKGTVTMPFYDGDESVRRQKKAIAKLVEQAKKLAPNEPELAYMIAREAPHTKARYLRLAQVVSQHPEELFGFSGAYAVYKAAKELGLEDAVSKWFLRSKSELRSADEISRLMYVKFYSLDPKVWSGA